jgi:O-antigen/teichoic acid export membrane protein
MERPAWNLLTGTLTKYVLLLVNIVLGIFLMPFTMRHLGQTEYGLWMLAASMTAYFQLLDLGYGSGLVRHVTQADARGDDEEVNTVLSTFVVVYGAIGLATVAITIFMTLAVLPRFPNLSPAQVTTAQWILTILAARIAIGFPMGVFGAVTTARQKFALTGWIAVVVALAQGAATYLVLRAGFGLIPLVASTTAIGVISYAAYAAAAYHSFPAMRLSVARFSGRRVREVTTFSFYLFLISIAVYVSASVDNLIIGAYIGTAAIAVYTVAARLAEYQRQLCGQFTGFLFPLVVRFHESRDTDALRTTLLDGTRIALALVAGFALCLAFYGRELIQLWMGPGFEAAAVPLYVLSLAGIVMVAQGPTGTILLGTGRHRLVAWASVADIALNIVLSAALVRQFGLTGVAAGTAIPFVVLNVFLLMPVACRTIHVPLVLFARVVGLPTLAGVLPAALLATLLRSSGEAGSVAALLAQAALVGVVYVVAVWSIGLTSADRARYMTSIRQVAFAAPNTPRAATL